MSQDMREPLLDAPSAPSFDEVKERPPPFAPGSRPTPEASAPAAQSTEREGAPAPRRNSLDPAPAAGGRSGDGVVLVEVHHYHQDGAQEGICCPLMIFILGFSIPTLWIFGCCYLGSRNPTVRLLGRASIIALGISLMTAVIIVFNIWARSGKWPWV
mmetsp:Transcript_31907/g.76201  ORF Transcript_31907/g.76201 Transcript_31907/m.76201 type:complete len:157 (-) Transcript_31907:232-702(-)|eukprot:CAMPEP_0177720314 /NCGR_PEP_ID=MMETSP0484_2-20121128/16561_1 /TAXON_ID=354590 /ORGANISM="Rhodomonas lens, Strain RHODO" /LENGTH=156 /DNA_ID=CAMNT_0019232571 /DNA_START=133 /DNA_END=603 /DNA_ORIENTATION=+